ncbi:MAG: DNA photolyase [Chitinispirillia bacterium]|jgi:spore photoproduct lyase
MYQNISSIPEEVLEERNRIVKKDNNGSFWKSCPGTGDGYLCCGYQIVTPFIGCGMYCSYCILQEYFNFQNYVIFKNIDDLEKEIHKKISYIKGIIRVGTGEFADSLYFEHVHGLSSRIVSILDPYANVLTELKTKSNNINILRKIKNPSKVVIGFSMNTERLIKIHEKGTASLEERVNAAVECEKMGFWVAFHFDPIIWYPQWYKEYEMVIDTIFSKIQDLNRIAWISLGGFRTMPSLKNRLRKYKLHIPLFAGEMIIGHDKKYRYFRPLRIEFYTTFQNIIEKYFPEITLYLCMESPEVWRDSGLYKRIPDGLVKYLDLRAKDMLGYCK